MTFVRCKWLLSCSFLMIFLACKSDLSELAYLEVGQSRPAGLLRLVSDVSNNVITPSYERLHRDVENLEESISRECSDTRKFNRDRLKSTFIQAMRSYHFTEAFQIGVIARNAYQVRERIYPDYFSLYSIDEEIAMKQADGSYQYKTSPNRIGFPALEYLIFEDRLVNQCPDCRYDVMKKWNALADTVKLQNRCDYMEHVSVLLSREIRMLRDSWLPVDRDITLSQTYRQDFKVVKEFAIRLTHSLNFFDHEVKDVRLGVPSGINKDWCAEDSCPHESEHIHSQDSLSSIFHSVKGLLGVFTGDQLDSRFDTIKAGYGYEEWLVENGHEKLAQRLKNEILNFLENIRELKGHSVESLAKGVSYRKCTETTSENRIVEICALYQDLKKITDIYKNDFLLAMDFGRPVEQGGDTD